MGAFLFGFLVLRTLLIAQGAQEQRSLTPLHYFVGEWVGTGDGEPGVSTVSRTYRFVLDERFLQVENTSAYAPQEINKKGEVHSDIGFFSFDKSRKRIAFRQFHSEGFVNQYSMDSLSADGKTFTLLTESIENIPAGWRAKEVYRILNENEFEEVFSLAPPGKYFEVYSTTRLKRNQPGEH